MRGAGGVLEGYRETLGSLHPSTAHLRQQPQLAAAGQGDLAAAEQLRSEELDDHLLREAHLDGIFAALAALAAVRI